MVDTLLYGAPGETEAVQRTPAGPVAGGGAPGSRNPNSVTKAARFLSIYTELRAVKSVKATALDNLPC